MLVTELDLAVDLGVHQVRATLDREYLERWWWRRRRQAGAAGVSELLPRLLDS